MIEDGFSTWLKHEIDLRGWSQADLAREAKISRQAVSNVVNQVRAPGPDVCKKIANAFNMDPQIVFMKAGILPDKNVQNELLSEIHYKLDMVPEDKLESILEIIDAFLIKNRAAYIVADKKEAYKTKK